LFAKYNYRKADKIVAVSEGLKKEYIREFKIPKKKIVGIWNGNDVNLIQCKKNASIPEKEKSWLVSDRTVVTMGRLSEEKGQIHLLHAFSQVVKKIPDARLLLLGDGPLKDKLIKGARQLGIEDNVFFCGFQENPFSILAKSDLFVFTSLYEGYGYALAEAICCGIPCITTDFEYGAREILRYQDNAIIKDAVYTDYGVLVPVCKDSSDNDITREEMILAESIIQMLSDREYRNNVVMNNLKRLDDFSIERMGEKWEQVLEDR
jgi:glycosyltransferase involved in cell wall biosynthesis